MQDDCGRVSPNYLDYIISPTTTSEFLNLFPNVFLQLPIQTMGTASSVQMIVVTLWLYFRVYTDSPNRIFADLLARQFPPNFAWVCFAQIHSTSHGHTDKIQRSSILFRTMEITRDADRRTNRQCSSTWQTVLFIIFIAACPALLIPGAIIRARYEKYKNDFMRKCQFCLLHRSGYFLFT
jgi:hypothetical protein